MGAGFEGLQVNGGAGRFVCNDLKWPGGCDSIQEHGTADNLESFNQAFGRRIINWFYKMSLEGDVARDKEESLTFGIQGTGQDCQRDG